MFKTKNVVLKYFKKETNTNGFLCRFFCGWKTSNNSTRMLKHISTNCTEVPYDVKNRFNKTSMDEPSASSSVNNQEMEDVPSPEIMSTDEKAKIDEVLARMIYESGMSPKMVEEVPWINLITGLNPFYILPTPEMLRGYLLDNEVMRLKVKGDAMIEKSEYLGLMCNIWKNKADESCLNIFITTPTPVFVKCILSYENDPEYIANEIEQVICAYGSTKFYGITINNFEEMIPGLQLVKEHYPNLIVYECLTDKINDFLSEGFNLETIKSLISDGETLVKAFYSIYLGIDIPDKSRTRWIAVMNFLEGILENKKYFQDDQSEVSMPAHSIITSELFWKKITSFYNFLLKILNLIKKVEKETSNLSQAYVFYKIKTEFEKFLEKIDASQMEKNKFNEMIETGEEFKLSLVHKTAYMLDPRYHGCKLLESEKEEVLTFLRKFAMSTFNDPADVDKFTEEYLEYLAKGGIFAKKRLWDKNRKIMEPRTWWKKNFVKTLLSEISIKILSLPLTSATCDRSRNNLRELLDEETDEKRIYCRHMLKLEEATTVTTKIIFDNDEEMEGYDSDGSSESSSDS